MRNKNERRHHEKRMYDRAVKMISIWESDPEHLEWRVKRIYNNMANCSCSMCGNERGNGWSSNRMKLTMQERRAADGFEADYQYWYDYAQHDAKYAGYEVPDDWYSDDYFWGAWYYRDTPEIMHLKWKYCNQVTDEDYMWSKLRDK